MTTTRELLEPIEKLNRDVRAAAVTLSPMEVRYLVDYYYLQQEDRKRANNQARALGEGGEPHEVVQWLATNARMLEAGLKRVLDTWSDGSPVGVWMKGIVGIGPIITAGMLAHIDIEKAPTAGHIWRFAGLDPTSEWGKGQKRPWNARLKVLCWHLGESFVKVQNREGDFYGQLYVQRKEYEQARNEAGGNAEAAAKVLASKKINTETEAHRAYSAGKLPPAQIHARAKRWVTKLFLSHLHWVMYEEHYGRPVPFPYVITHMGHADVVSPPNYTPLARESKRASEQESEPVGERGAKFVERAI